MGNTIIGKEESHSIVLKCQAPDSFPDRQIQWSKVDPQNQGQRKPLPQSSHYTISANGDVHFSFVKSGDSGDYICTVTNNIINKHVVRTVVLNVMPVRPLVNQPPMISPEFTVPKIALKGERFMLECIVYGMPVPKITIRMKGIHMILGQITGNARRYFIKSFSKSDAGKYKCKATDPSGRSDARSATVTMEAKPEWIIKPHDTTAGLSSNATLSCQAYGIPRVHYQWYFNGIPLRASAKYSFQEGNVTLSNLQYYDGGMYQCVVTNRHGQFVTSAELTVAETAAGFGPGSKAPELILNKLVHSTVMLTCNPSGNPKPLVRWRKGSTFLRLSSRYHFFANGNLQIINVTKYDTGRYTCEVSNRLGSDSKSGILNVQENLAISSPPTDKTATLGSNVRFRCGVTTMGAMEITIEWSRYYILVAPTSRITIGPPEPPTYVDILPKTQSGYYINITWVLGRDNQSPITHVLVEQNIDFEPYSWTLVKTIDDTLQTRVEIPLSPWAQYTFRVLAVNAVGKSKPSAPSSTIATPPNAPEKVPRKIRSRGKSPTTMLINWKPLSSMEQNGPGIYYIVYYKVADSKGKMNRQEVRHNRTRFTVRGTDYFVKYAFQVQAANIRGFGPKSKIQYGYSGERYPIGRPTRLEVRITSPTSAYATWAPVAGSRDIAGGKLLGYKVYFWTGSKEYRPRRALYKSSISSSAMLELEPFTHYRFQVVAYNSRGNGPGSNIVGPMATPMAFSTFEPLSPKPTTNLMEHFICKNFIQTLLVCLSADHVRGLSVRWGRPKKTSVLHIDRLVDSKTVSGATNFSTQLRVHNLDLQTRYQFSVRAINRIGEGPPVMADFDLATIPLSWPPNVIASYDEFQREASVRWTQIKKPVIDGYRVYYWGLDKVVKFVDVERDRSERTIPRLTKGSDYHFQVAAFRLVNGEHYAIGPRSPPIKAGRLASEVMVGLPVYTYSVIAPLYSYLD
ncbi:hypothetical protein QZH41_003777 [Actinostola sp. cb2023]|nr:hypothetical protein QZH41_003777 [Actinostola sp. cb2023]